MRGIHSRSAGMLNTILVGLIVSMLAGSATAQVMVANDDDFYVPPNQTLVVDTPGILDNDLLDEESAVSMGAVAELVTPPVDGDLILNPDGSFSYSPGSTFTGLDSFEYAAVVGAASDIGTVFLSACTKGPEIFDCWKEEAWLAKATQYGLVGFTESFEDDLVWGSVRTPFSAMEVASQGVIWTSNHTYDPAFNPISTTPGPPRTGLWAGFDPEHGYATGTQTECDVDVPPEHCLYHDGITGTRELGLSQFYGVGGYVTGIYGAKVGISLDGTAPTELVSVNDFQFIGVISLAPAGFSRFSFIEQDGKIGQALFIWLDDLTMMTPGTTPVQETQSRETGIYFAGPRPNPSSGNTTFSFSLVVPTQVQLAVYDSRGRLVRELANDIRDPGTHNLTWDGRDSQGRRVAAGLYFGRLAVQDGRQQDVQVRKMMILH